MNVFFPALNCSGNFECSSTSCISKVNPECDRAADCPNGADERNCGKLKMHEARSMRDLRVILLNCVLVFGFLRLRRAPCAGLP